MLSVVISWGGVLRRARAIPFLKVFLILGLTSLFVACRSERSETRNLDGLELIISVSDSLLKLDEPFDIRFTLTNTESSPINLEPNPDGEPPAAIVVRVPLPSGQEWQEVASWAQGCGTRIELGPGESCSITATWAISQDLGVDAAVIVGGVWYNDRWQEVAVGVALSPSPF